MIKSEVIKNLIMLIAAVNFFGCAHLDNGDRASRGQLIQRVNAYWNARIEDRVETTYSIEDPEGRKKVSLSRYARTAPIAQQAGSSVIVKLLSFKILAVDLNGDKAKVTIQQTTRITGPGIRSELKLSTEEQWVRVQGKWYHELKDPRAQADMIIQLYQKKRQQKSPSESP